MCLINEEAVQEPELIYRTIVNSNITMERILNVSKADINVLVERAKGVKRALPVITPSYGRKLCPTRHGCQGATDCNYSYGSYQG